MASAASARPGSGRDLVAPEPVAGDQRQVVARRPVQHGALGAQRLGRQPGQQPRDPRLVAAGGERLGQAAGLGLGRGRADVGVTADAVEHDQHRGVGDRGAHAAQVVGPVARAGPGDQQRGGRAAVDHDRHAGGLDAAEPLGDRAGDGGVDDGVLEQVLAGHQACHRGIAERHARALQLGRERRRARVHAARDQLARGVVEHAHERDIAGRGLERRAGHQRQRGLVGAGRGLADGVGEHLHLPGGTHRVLVAARRVERAGAHLAERRGERRVVLVGHRAVVAAGEQHADRVAAGGAERRRHDGHRPVGAGVAHLLASAVVTDWPLASTRAQKPSCSDSDQRCAQPAPRPSSAAITSRPSCSRSATAAQSQSSVATAARTSACSTPSASSAAAATAPAASRNRSARSARRFSCIRLRSSSERPAAAPSSPAISPAARATAATARGSSSAATVIIAPTAALTPLMTAPSERPWSSARSASRFSDETARGA